MFTPEILYGVGAVALALAIAWGIRRDRRRNRANDATTDAATRAAFDNPAEYDRTQDDYKGRTRPS